MREFGYKNDTIDKHPIIAYLKKRGRKSLVGCIKRKLQY
jgi:hypothetical protein